MEDGVLRQIGTPEEIWESEILRRVFGVSVERIKTQDGWRYFYGSDN
jgi:ABC-type cobalamin/Fe3+-siderophores transport system ATPase subunit